MFVLLCVCVCLFVLCDMMCYVIVYVLFPIILLVNNFVCSGLLQLGEVAARRPEVGGGGGAVDVGIGDDHHHLPMSRS